MAASLKTPVKVGQCATSCIKATIDSQIPCNLLHGDRLDGESLTTQQTKVTFTTKTPQQYLIAARGFVPRKRLKFEGDSMVKSNKE